MAYSNGMPERPEGFLYQQPPREQPFFQSFTSPLSPLRNLNVPANGTLTTGEGRGSLVRRFTTNALPTNATLSPIGQQRRQAAEPNQFASTAINKITPSEKKARQYEELLAQQRRIQAQMALIDPETRREVDEHRRLEQDINMFTSGHQSEPSTPPDLYTSPHVAVRSNRFSASNLSMTSPPGIHNRPSRSGSQLTSPAVNFARPFTAQVQAVTSTKSVPGSRRGSDEEEEDWTAGFSNPDERKLNINRNSMPVKMADLGTMLGDVNTTSFLFGDDDDHKNAVRQAQAQANPAASPDAKTYLQLHANEDKFPILLRREGDGNMQLSASSAALDLALSQSPGLENQPTTDRSTAARHRQSLPPSAMRQPAYLAGDSATSPRNGLLTDLHTAKNTAANRRSMEVKFSGISETALRRPGLLASPKNGMSGSLPKLQSSYSMSDVPTLKSTNAMYHSDIKAPAARSPYNDYISPDRQPSAMLSQLSATSNRHSQEIQLEAPRPEEPVGGGYLAQRSALQASAPSFGPPAVPTLSETGNNMGAMHPQGMGPYGGPGPAYYGGYGMQMLNAGFNNMHLGNNQGQAQWSGQGQWPGQGGQMSAYQGPFGGYSQYPQAAAPRFPDNQSRAVQQRRVPNGEDSTRFANVKLESLTGEIYGLCKDQHGCRYLQKKLEDRSPEHVQLIFEETNAHVVELMTDPFGNYLCQKLLEYANDDQRTTLIRNAAPQMVKIALNQHGTRALQKMIEFISTREQIEIIIEALKFEVVTLIQDLNGNHVIQKCLNHLSPEDAQFIFNAVGYNCVVVGTHRHGCCVLQRCIDHASGNQKGELIAHITANAFALVQDPFGNYVVQYILDLGEPSFSQPLCRSFCGSIVALSKQKFSSNVIEKCIRTAEEDVRRIFVDEIMVPQELEKLLRDSFANYVVQTAMDYADPETKARLIDNIRPILPSIRHTPYGRRIQGKIQDYDGRANGGSDTMSPGQLGNKSFMRGAGPQTMSTFSSPGSPFTNGGNNYTTAAIPARTPPRMLGQQAQQFPQGFPALGNHGPRPTGMNHF